MRLPHSYSLIPHLWAHWIEQKIYDTVAWDRLETFMTTLNDTQRTNAVKCFHDWQNTGGQNLKFKEHESAKPDALSYTNAHTVCPFECVELNTPIRYFYRKSPVVQHASTTLLTSIQATLKKEHTSIPVYNVIIQNLKHHTQQTHPLPQHAPQNISPHIIRNHDYIISLKDASASTGTWHNNTVTPNVQT